MPRHQVTYANVDCAVISDTSIEDACIKLAATTEAQFTGIKITSCSGSCGSLVLNLEMSPSTSPAQLAAAQVAIAAAPATVAIDIVTSGRSSISITPSAVATLVAAPAAPAANAAAAESAVAYGKGAKAAKVAKTAKVAKVAKVAKAATAKGTKAVKAKGNKTAKAAKAKAAKDAKGKKSKGNKTGKAAKAAKAKAAKQMLGESLASNTRGAEHSTGAKAALGMLGGILLVAGVAAGLRKKRGGQDGIGEATEKSPLMASPTAFELVEESVDAHARAEQSQRQMP